MRAAQLAIEQFDQEKLKELMQGNSVVIYLDGQPVTLTSEDVQVERVVLDGLIAANQGLITIALDTQLTEDLLIEGLAREIVNKVNTMRREANLAVTDRIHLHLQTTERVKSCFAQYNNYICHEGIAVGVQYGPCVWVEWDLNGEPTKISITPV